MASFCIMLTLNLDKFAKNKIEMFPENEILMAINLSANILVKTKP